MPAWVWLLLGVVLIGAEVLSGDFVLLMVGVAGLAAGGVAAITGGLVAPLIVFALVAVGLVTFARPALRRRLHAGTSIRTNTEALIGSSAVVVSTVDETSGRVKIGGEVWSARTLHTDRMLEPGTRVTVIDISGATAIVLEQQ